MSSSVDQLVSVIKQRYGVIEQPVSFPASKSEPAAKVKAKANVCDKDRYTLEMLHGWVNQSFLQLNAPLITALKSYYYWQHKRDCVLIEFKSVSDALAVGRFNMVVNYISPPLYREEALKHPGYNCGQVDMDCFRGARERLRQSSSGNKVAQGTEPFYLVCMLDNVAVISCVDIEPTPSIVSAVDASFIEHPHQWCIENQPEFGPYNSNEQIIALQKRQCAVIRTQTRTTSLRQHLLNNLLTIN